MTYTRYAIYYAPAPGALSDFGARWLGWDIETGTERPHPEIPGLPRPVEEITRTPRKYGFHGTIKPPFHLAQGRTEDDLIAAAETACGAQPPVMLDGLHLTQLGRFLALVPIGDTDALSTLAAAVVRDLDPFRAPASEAELARRRARHLSDRQDALLTQWGYPYVMEEFRFHMTLTGPLPKAEATQVADCLGPEITPLLTGPITIDSLCLLGELENKRLRIVRRLPLTG
jgi:putative phosphonate metabolism protein